MLVFLTFLHATSFSSIYQKVLGNALTFVGKGSNNVHSIDKPEKTRHTEFEKHTEIDLEEIPMIYQNLKKNVNLIIRKNLDKLNNCNHDSIVMSIKKTIYLNGEDTFRNIEKHRCTKNSDKILNLATILGLALLEQYQHLFIEMVDMSKSHPNIRNYPYENVIEAINRKKTTVKLSDNLDNCSQLQLYILQNEIAILVDRCSNDFTLLDYFIKYPKLIECNIKKGFCESGKTFKESKFIFYDILYHFVNDIPILGKQYKYFFKQDQKLVGAFLVGIYDIYIQNPELSARKLDDEVHIKFSFPNLNYRTMKCRLKESFKPFKENKEVYSILMLPFTYCDENRYRITLNMLVDKETVPKLKEVIHAHPFLRLEYEVSVLNTTTSSSINHCFNDFLGLQYNPDCFKGEITHLLLNRSPKDYSLLPFVELNSIISSWLLQLLHSENDDLSYLITLSNTGNTTDIRDFVVDEGMVFKFDQFFNRCGPFKTFSSDYKKFLADKKIACVSMIKDAVEDRERHRQDMFVNKRLAWIVRDARTEKICVEEIDCGDVILVRENEEVPADIVLLSSNHEKCRTFCFVETSSLDGESNLKRKNISGDDICTCKNGDTISRRTTQDDNIEITECDKRRISRVKDFNVEETGELLNDIKCIVKTSKENLYQNEKNILLKGSILKNTTYIIGLAISVGIHTKQCKNRIVKDLRVSLFERMVNRQLCFVFIAYFFVLAFTSMLGSLFLRRNDISYLNLNFNRSNDALVLTGTNYILFSYLVPISLFVTIEIARILGGLFIKNDRNMAFGSETMCRNTNVIEDLGIINHILTDKTGTLTKNEMVLKFIHLHKNTHLIQVKSGDTELTDNSLELSSPSFLNLSDPHTLFILALLSCNSVERFYNRYEGQSQDEISILEGISKEAQLIERTENSVTVKMYNHKIKIPIIMVLEFTSARQRMSVVVKLKDSFILFSKGSDQKLLPLMQSVDSVKKIIDNNSFYRSLVIGYKVIKNIGEYVEAYKHLGFEGRDSRIENLFNKMEDRSLHYLGTTFVEDSLQDDIKSTIKDFLAADISVWMVTGDKKETACSCGALCGLKSQNEGGNTSSVCNNQDSINDRPSGNQISSLEHDSERTKDTNGPNSEVDDLEDDNIVASTAKEGMPPHEGENNKGQNIESNQEGVRAKAQKYGPLNTPQKSYNRYQNITEEEDSCEVLMASDAIKKLETKEEIKNKAIIYRASPEQKSKIARLLVHNNANVLSIGDGNNDVMMLQASCIGVGIRGCEGTQASLSADFSVPEFKCLKRLMFVHGRYTFMRFSKLCLNSLYKNILLIFIQIYYNFFNGYSGRPVYNLFFLSYFNVLFTSIVPFYIAIFDKDRDEDELMAKPSEYKNASKYFNSRAIILNVILAITKASIIFWLSYFCFRLIDFTSGNGLIGGYSAMNNYFSLFVFLTVSFRQYRMINHYNYIAYTCIFLTWVLYFVSLFGIQEFNETTRNSAYHLYGMPVFYFALISIFGLVIFIDVIYDTHHAKLCK